MSATEILRLLRPKKCKMNIGHDEPVCVPCVTVALAQTRILTDNPASDRPSLGAVGVAGVICYRCQTSNLARGESCSKRGDALLYLEERVSREVTRTTFIRSQTEQP
jgi:hypothetical protein